VTTVIELLEAFASMRRCREALAIVTPGHCHGRSRPATESRADVQLPAGGLAAALPALEIQTRWHSTDPIVVAPDQALQAYWPGKHERARLVVTVPLLSARPQAKTITNANWAEPLALSCRLCPPSLLLAHDREARR
jgi:hypothetical protein